MNDDSTDPATFASVVKRAFLFFLAVALAALLAFVWFNANGCTSPDEPIVVPVYDQPCPPKRRCLFDSTGAVIAVLPLAADDSWGCGATVR